MARVDIDHDGFLTLDGLRLPVKVDLRRGCLQFKDKCKRRIADRRRRGEGGPNGDILEVPLDALWKCVSTLK